ncbi:CBO0543 family protein [Sporomusa aerivorans]|uniref:CBO0543 family protein n=1 Tax=Sporomusa aerivorans TaxID=204936 RepID=UPI003529E2BA
MILEGILLAAAAIVSILSLIATPKDKLLQMQFILFLVQVPTWLLGLTMVEFGLLEYPYRELASVNRTSFIFEYIVFPVICVHVNNYFPWQATPFLKTIYLATIGLLLTGFEFMLEHYTMLIKYTGWQWYWTWGSEVLIFGLTQKTVAWFFRLHDKQ